VQSMMDRQKAILGQRIANRMPSGAAPGGMQPSAGSPPPPMGMQQPPGVAPQASGQSQLAPLLEQVMQVLVQGNPADLEVFGQFMARIKDMVQQHQGQGTMQSAPAPPASPIP